MPTHYHGTKQKILVCAYLLLKAGQQMKEGEQREYKDKTTQVLEKDWQQSPSITDFSLSNYPPHLKSFNLPFIITKNKLY